MNLEKKCVFCKGALEELIVFDKMPASAQNIPTKEELESDAAVTLPLCQCTKCGLVQFDTEPVNYYKDVIRVGGGTKTMKQLRNQEYLRLAETMKQQKLQGNKIIEIGCGQGEFLEMWQDDERLSEFAVYGIEHSTALVQKAMEKGLSVEKNFAEGDNHFANGPFDAFVQFNFLEHQPDPVSMLNCVWNNLKEEAVGLITVPSFEYILEHDGYYELLRDHIVNYSMDTLENVLSVCGFQVLDKRMVNRDTIEMIVKKSEKGEILHPFAGTFTDVSSLQTNYDEMLQSLTSYFEALKRKNRTLAIWGASHQGFTLAATTELGGKAQYIIDSSPLKQGKYSPVSHLPIVAPSYVHQHPVDEILIVAPGYADEIAEIIRRDYSNEIKIMVLRSKKMENYGE